MTGLDFLNLSGAGLAAKEAPALAEQLRKFPALKRVDVSGNPGLDRASLSFITAAFSSKEKVKLGWKEFDVNSEKIDANRCGVPAADLALFAARVKTGEICRVKILHLVIFFPIPFLLCIFRLLCAALRQR